MSFRISRLAAALVLSSAFAGGLQAQTGAMHLGPRVSYQFDLEEVGIGAQLGVPIARNLEFYPSLDYFFVDVGSFLSLNADLKYRIATRDINWLYLGGGLNVARRGLNGNSNTDAGINGFVGAESRAGRVHPFAEFRFTSNNGSTGQLSVGLNFTLRQ